MQISDGELETIYSQYRQQLFTCALVITGSSTLAEDAVHEAFCKLLGRRPESLNPKAYVFQSVRNAAIDLVRRLPMVGLAEPEGIFDPGHITTLEDADFQQAVVELMQQLSADERETIVQHLYGDLTFREIATVRELPLGTIVSWYRRGLEKLRRKLEVPDGSV